MATARKVATPAKRTANSCPHCKWGTLTKSVDTLTDTDDQKRAVWDCDVCDYSEGR
jgi:hypothetical protein